MSMERQLRDAIEHHLASIDSDERAWHEIEQRLERGVAEIDGTTSGITRTRRRNVAQLAAAITVAGMFVAFAVVAATIVADAPERREILGERQHGSLESDGWTLTVPAGWHTTPILPCEVDGRPRTGVIVSNVDFEFRDPGGGAPSCEDRFVFAGFPADGVALSYEPTGIGTGFFQHERTFLPLALEDLQPTRSIRGGPAMSYTPIVRDRGPIAFVRAFVGDSASPEDRELLGEMLSSLTVAALETDPS